LERELLALEQSKHLESHVAHELEIRLLAHENRIIELSAAVEAEAKREDENREIESNPQELLRRARQLVERAEADLKRHHEAGRQHLTQALEHEIQVVINFEKELIALEKSHHLDSRAGHNVLIRLAEHEKRLAELSAAVEHEGNQVENNPQELLRRARALIERAEADLKRHHEAGRQHLTQALEHEIQAVVEYEKELIALEKNKQLDSRAGHEVVLKLAEHEKRLAELSAAVEHEGRQEPPEVQLAPEVEEVQKLPEILIHRAREIIKKAEEELHRHHQAQRQHLTHELEAEIELVRHLERELLALEQHKHLESHVAHEVELKLLAHENRLEELTLAIEHHETGHESRNRE